jgi:cytochrome c biogenesis protein CcmG/thiol:disulfide interchange protein DsbE
VRMRSPIRVLVVLAVTSSLLFLLGYGLAANRPHRTLDQAIERGQRDAAPSIKLAALSTGRMTSLRSYRGRVVLVNYWASWCGPCSVEAPLLEQWYKRIKSMGGVVLGIDTYDVTSDATSFIHQFHLTYPMLRDPGGQAKGAFGVSGFPESFVIDRQGRVAALERGPVNNSFMAQTVIPLLGEPS